MWTDEDEMELTAGATRGACATEYVGASRGAWETRGADASVRGAWATSPADSRPRLSRLSSVGADRTALARSTQLT